MGNTPVVAKQDIAKYVKDMAEIEAAEFTLRKAAEEMRRDAEVTLIRSRTRNEKINSNLENAKFRLAEAKKEKNTLQEKLIHREAPQRPEEPLKPLGWEYCYFDEETKTSTYCKDLPSSWDARSEVKGYVGITAIVAIIATPILSFLVYAVTLNELLGIIISLIIVSIGGTIYGTIDYKKSKTEYYSKLQKKVAFDKFAKEYAEFCEKFKEWREACTTLEREERKNQDLRRQIDNVQKEINKHESIIKTNENDLPSSLKKQSDDESRLQYVFAQADLLLRTADELHAKKEALYRANIIPPDYRELDCVLMFHQIFRNDLADTMREAVKIYEERVFRREVIRGIDKIYCMLGQLSSSMSSIENRLVQIRDEVKLMGNDVYQMSQNLANSQSAILKSIKQGQRETARYQDMSRSEQQRFQDKMLSETRASVYATEALKDATDKLVWYEQQKYWKNM